jgi:NAD(P)-dependent dehydrogenase (short-subunit alcohol dehydrogenase family)
MIETDMLIPLTPERRALLQSITPAAKFGVPDDIAASVLYLLSSNFLYGAVVHVDGGWQVKNG